MNQIGLTKARLSLKQEPHFRPPGLWLALGPALSRRNRLQWMKPAPLPPRPNGQGRALLRAAA
ncbi:MAG: hypothetical protein V3T57_07090, partial [Kiloniellales bacterium]